MWWISAAYLGMNRALTNVYDQSKSPPFHYCNCAKAFFASWNGTHKPLMKWDLGTRAVSVGHQILSLGAYKNDILNATSKAGGTPLGSFLCSVFFLWAAAPWQWFADRSLLNDIIFESQCGRADRKSWSSWILFYLSEINSIPELENWIYYWKSFPWTIHYWERFFGAWAHPFDN